MDMELNKQNTSSIRMVAAIWVLTVVLFSIIYIGCYEFPFLFKVHVFCMCTGYLLCIGEAIRRNKPDLNNISQENRRKQHLQYSSIGGILIFIGFVCIVANKYTLNKPIFSGSWHAWFGFITIILTAIQGVVGWMKRNALQQIPSQRRYRWHGQLGGIIFRFSFISIASGIFVVFFERFSVALIPLYLLLMVIFALFYCLFWKDTKSNSATHVNVSDPQDVMMDA